MTYIRSALIYLYGDTTYLAQSYEKWSQVIFSSENMSRASLLIFVQELLGLFAFTVSV